MYDSLWIDKLSPRMRKNVEESISKTEYGIEAGGLMNSSITLQAVISDSQNQSLVVGLAVLFTSQDLAMFIPAWNDRSTLYSSDRYF